VNAPVATEAALTVERPPTVEKKPQPQTSPKRKEPERPKIVKAKKIQEPPKQLPPEPITPPQPEPVAEPLPPTETASVASANAASVTNMNNKGVIGGATGGHVGGVIGGRGIEPLPADQVANPPLLLSRVSPEYPRVARRQGIEGLVVLEAILDLNGHIEEGIKVLQSIPLLDDAAVQALRHWRFRPARDHDNQPVRVILEVPVRFVLK
jgi:protein TonB